MKTVTHAEVVAALAAEAPGVVATDADGTLWEGDVGEDWLDAIAAGHAAIDEARLAATAARLLPDGALASRDAGATVRAARAAYAAAAIEERAYFELVALTLGGAPEATLRPLVRAGLAAAGLGAGPEARLIAEARAVVGGARAHGHRVVVVSASPRLVVEEALALACLEVDAVVGLELTADGTRTRTPFPYAEGKATLLAARAAGATIHAALGDSAFDAAMLALARRPLAVRPRPALVRAAPSVPGLRLLARSTAG